MATFVCFLFLQQKVGELYGRTTEKDDTAHDDVSTEKTPKHTVGKQEAGGTFEHEEKAVRDTRARDVVLSLEKRQREASRCARE